MIGWRHWRGLFAARRNRSSLARGNGRWLLIGSAVWVLSGLRVEAGYSGNLFLQSQDDDNEATADKFISGNLIWYRNIWQSDPSGTGTRWMFWEWDSFAKKYGTRRDSGTEQDFVNNTNDVQFLDTIDAGGNGNSPDWSPDAENIWFDAQNGKSYVFNLTDNDNGSLEASPGNNMAAFALVEIDHQNALVQFTNVGTRTERVGSEVLMHSGSTSEDSGSNEELWFQWTKDDFSTKNFIVHTDISNDVPVALDIGTGSTDIKENDTLKWLVMSTATVKPTDSPTNTISGTTRGVLNWDAAAVYKATNSSDTDWLFEFTVPDDDTNAPVLSGFGVFGDTGGGFGTTNLQAGDIAILGFNGDGDDDFSFVTFVDIAPGTVIKFTDNGVSGGALDTSEGTIIYTTAVHGLRSGSVVVMADPGGTPAPDQGSAAEDGNFNFSGSGDQLIVYQDPGATTNFIYGLDTDSTEWSEVPPGLETNGTPLLVSNAVPVTALHVNQHLEGGADEDNGRYTGTLVGTKNDLLESIARSANWELTDGSGDQSLSLSSTDMVALQRIVFQGFERSIDDGWGINSGAGNISADLGAADTPAFQRIRGGTNAWLVNNETASLELSNVLTKGWTRMRVRARLSSTSGTSGNGADGADEAEFFVRLDNAAFGGTADVEVEGNSNAKWGYDADLMAGTTAGVTVVLSAPQGGENANNYAIVDIAIPDGTTNVAMKVTAMNNSADEFWNVDDIELMGVPPGGGSLVPNGTTNEVTDGDILIGGWTIAGLVQDVLSGVNENGTTTSGDDFSPNFDVLNNAGSQIVVDQLFSNRPADGSAMETPEFLQVINAPAAGSGSGASSTIDLGTNYRVRVSATDNDEDPNTGNDRSSTIDELVTSFTVVDDDTEPPISAEDTEWRVYFNVPDGTGASASGDDHIIRDALLSHVAQLDTGHTGILATFTFSGDTDANGYAGPLLKAMSNAVERGATLFFVADKGVNVSNNFSTGTSLTQLNANANFTLSHDDSANGIVHHKFGLFDHGTDNRWVFTGSENFTGAGSFQWNVAFDIRDDEIYSHFLEEATNLIAGVFHDDPNKSHNHHGQEFSMLASWSSNTVKFAPVPDTTIGGDNLERDITNLIRSAQSQIVIAVTELTRDVIADALIDAADANQRLRVDIALPEFQTTNGFTASIFSKLTNTANYAGTNIAHFHRAFTDDGFNSRDAGDDSDLVHAKYMVVDPLSEEPVVFHGSGNWSLSALRDDDENDENWVVVRNKGVARRFFEQFRTMTGLFQSDVATITNAGDAVTGFTGDRRLLGTDEGTNRILRITDGEMATNSNPLDLHLHLFDPDSGLNRDANDANKSTNLQVTVENFTTDNVTNFVAGSSSSAADTRLHTASSVWAFVSIASGDIGNMVGNTNRISVTGHDADNDRANDALAVTNSQVGFLAVSDDDTVCPSAVVFVAFGNVGQSTVTVSELQSGGNAWAFTGAVFDVDSGVNSNGTSVIQPDNSPYFVLRDPNGVVHFSNAFTFAFSDGGALSAEPVSNTALPAIATPVEGTWTALVIVADNDEDFGNDDHLICTNEFTFKVISQPTFEWDAEGADRDWSTVENWTGDTEPGLSGGVSNVFVNGGFTAVVSQAGEVALNLEVGGNGQNGGADNGTGRVEQVGGVLTISDTLTLGESENDLGTYISTNGTLSTATDLLVGDGGSGTLAVGDVAEVIVSNNLVVSDDSTGSGSLIVSGGTVNVTADLTVGNAGVGTATVEGGAVTANVLRISSAAGSGGSSVTVSGGRLALIDDIVMNFESTLDVSGGELEGDMFDIGSESGHKGTINLSDGTITANNNVDLGDANGGTGVLNQTGGTLDLVGGAGVTLELGTQIGASGFYTITNGTLTTDSDVNIGRANSDGTGVFHVVGPFPDITVGDNQFDEFRMQADNAELRFTLVDSLISTVKVQGDIILDGAISISNVGPIVAGEYVVMTSLTEQAVNTRFDATNWLGGVTGAVSYTGNRVLLTFDSEMAVLGTNLAEIADGDLSPEGDKGTDYGNVLEAGGTKDHTFTITNTGPARLLLDGDPIIATSGVHAADFIVTANPSTPVDVGGTETFTIRFDPSGLGGRTAEVSIANSDLDEDPYNFRLTGTGTLFSVDPPSDAIGLPDGAEAADLSWTKNANGDDVLILMSVTNPPTGDPSDGVAFDVDDIIGNAQVIFNGSATNFKAVELIPASTNFFNFYSRDPDTNYSSAISSTVTTEEYRADEIVDPFSYTNNVNLTLKDGGNNWTGAWEALTGAISNRQGSLLTPENYPDRHGHSVFYNSSGAGSQAVRYRRGIETVDEGLLYVSYAFSVETNGTDRFSGMRWLDGDTLKMFMGLRGNFTSASWEQEGGAVAGDTGVEVVPHGNRTDEIQTNSYLFLMKYNFDTEEFKMMAYTSATEAVELVEPATWDSEATLQAGFLTRVTHLEFAGGNFGGNPDLGDLYWDEVRVATNWFELFGRAFTNPTIDSVTADGFEAADLNWTADGQAPNVLILRRGTNPPTARPEDGVAYNVGDAIGGGTVIFNSTGSSFKDTELGPGDTVHWAFHSRDGANNYSEGATTSLTLGTYGPIEVADPLSYELADSIDGKDGGTTTNGFGWTEAWNDEDAGNSDFEFAGHTGFSNAPAFAAPAYPESHGWQIKMKDQGNGQQGSATRGFEPVVCGRVFVGFMVSYAFDGANKFAGLEMMGTNGTGGAENYFAGEVGSADRILGIDGYGGEKDSSFNINPYAAGTAADTNNVYLIVARYDFDTREYGAKAFFLPSGVVSTNEPSLSEFDVVDTVTAARAFATVSGVRIKAGSSDAGASVGDAFWDEIRVARSWGDLMNLAPPRVTNYFVDAAADNEVTDGQMTGGTYSVRADFVSEKFIQSKFELQNPSFELTNDASVAEPPPDDWTFFSSGPDSSGVSEEDGARTGERVLQFFAPSGSTDTGDNQGYFQDVAIDLSASDSVFFSVYLRSEPGLPMQANVTNKIGIEFIGPAGESNRVESFIGSSQLSTSKWTHFTVSGNPVNNVNTARLTIVQVKHSDTAAAGVSWAEDVVAGLVVAPNYDVLTPDNNEVFQDEYFDDLTFNTDATQVTAIDTNHPLTPTDVVLGVHTIRVSAATSNEQALTLNETLQRLDCTRLTFNVVDDDELAPVFTGFAALDALGGTEVTQLTDQALFDGGWAFTGRVQDTGSGVNSNSIVTGDDFGVNFDLLNATNFQAIANELFTTNHPADGSGQAAPVRLEMVVSNLAPDKITLGVWTVRLSATDNDVDRTSVNDRSPSIDSNVLSIAVVDDDTLAPTLTGFTILSADGTRTNELTDGELAGGGYVITGLVQDTGSGLNDPTTPTASGDDFTINFDILNAAGTAIVIDQLFSNRPADGAALNDFEPVDTTNAPAAGAGGGSTVLDSGTYTLTVSLTDDDEDRIGDRTSSINVTVLTFSVSDDDTNSPTMDMIVVTNTTVKHLWINEFHYSDEGTDGGEFVEVMTSPLFTGSLAGVQVDLYNGADSTSYDSETLDNFTFKTNVEGYSFYLWEPSSIQNGPDGISLDDNGNLVEFLSYDGTFTGSGGPADGVLSVDVGVTEDSSTPEGSSLSRTNNGTVADDFVWSGPSPASSNGINTGQSLVLRLSDSQMRAGGYSVTGIVGDIDSGIFAPTNYDVRNSLALAIDREPFDVGPSANGDGRLLTNFGDTTPAIPVTNNVLGLATVFVSVVDFDADSSGGGDPLVTSTQRFIDVFDDDTNAPAIGTNIFKSSAGVSMDFLVGGESFYDSDAGTAALFRVSDADLVDVDGENPMEFIFNVFDEESGISHDPTLNQTSLDVVANYDIGTNESLQNIFRTYSNGLSSVPATAPSSTNRYFHEIPFTIGGTEAPFVETGELFRLMDTGDGYRIGTNIIRYSAPNDDRDWGRDRNPLEGSFITNDTEIFINKDIGKLVVFDDDRVAPTATITFVGTGWVKGATSDDQVTDAELKGGGAGLDLVITWFDTPSGVHVTNINANLNSNVISDDGTVIANWEVFSPTGLIGQDNVFEATNIFDTISATTLATNGDPEAVMVALGITLINFDQSSIGVWTATVSAQDFDLDRGVHTRQSALFADADPNVSWDREVRTNQPLAFTVADDDPDAPVPANIHAVSNFVAVNRNMHATLDDNSMNLGDKGLGLVGAGTNYNAHLTDGDLANLGAGGTNFLRFSFGVDDFSGLSRDATQTDTNLAMNLTISSVIVNNFSNYFADESAPIADNVNAENAGRSTNVWRFTQPFEEADINTLFGTNEILVTIPDTDGDRAEDTSTAVRAQWGFLIVEDDDIEPPALSEFQVSSTNDISVDGIATQLFFSEYAESGPGGGDSNKVLEIFNGTELDVDFAATPYEIQVFFNGETFFSGINGGIPANRTLITNGVLSADDVFVVAAQQAQNHPDFGGEVDLFIDSSTWFNGDDYIRLVTDCDASGSNCVVVDAIGRFGEDPGTEWSSSGVGTESEIIRRRKSVVDGDQNETDEFNPGDEWTFIDIATNNADWSGIGFHDITNDINVVTDQDIFLGEATITGGVRDVKSGIFSSSTNPFYSVNNTTGATLVAQRGFPNRPTPSGAAQTSTEPLFESPMPAAPSRETVTLGINTALVGVFDFDIDRPTSGDDTGSITRVAFRVIDDDEDPPALGTAAPGGRPLGVSIGPTNIAGSDTTTNAVFTITDGDLADVVGGTNLLRNWLFERGTKDFSIFGATATSVVIRSESGEQGTGVFFNACCDGFNGLFQDVPAQPLEAFEFSARVRKEANASANIEMKLEFHGTSSTNQFVTNIASEVTTDWQTFSLSVTGAPADVLTVRPVMLYFTNDTFNPGGATVDIGYDIDNWVLNEIEDHPFRLTASAFDTVSGLARGTDDSTTNSSLTLGTILANNLSRFTPSESSSSSVGSDTTNVWKFNSFHFSDIGTLFTEGQNEVDFTLFDLDNDRVTDRLSRVDHQFGILTVEDDDEGAPTHAAIDLGGVSDFLIVSNETGTITNSGSGTTRDWFVTDADLANVAVDALRLSVGAQDDISGLSRGTNEVAISTNDVMTLSIGAVIRDNLLNYAAAESSPLEATIGGPGTNVWLFDSFTDAEINQLLDAETNPVVVTIPDRDLDRPDDRSVLFNQQVGRLITRDDDRRGPFTTDLEVHDVAAHTTNLTDQQLRNGLYNLRLTYIDDSGVVTNPAQGFLPNYSMIQPTFAGSATTVVDVPWSQFDINGDANTSTNLTGFRQAVGVNFTNVTTGVWTFVWSAQDIDNDRTGDALAVTNSPFILNISNRVNVIDDDRIDPTPPSNVVATGGNRWTNETTITVTWAQGFDASGIAEYRSSTNAAAPTQISDGVPVIDTTALTNIGVSLTNASFEFAGDGEVVKNGATTNGWRGFGTQGTRGIFEDDPVEDGTNSLCHEVDAGKTGTGVSRFSLVGQDVNLDNSNKLPVRVWFSGSFNGDISPTNNGNQGVAFLKMEFFTADTQLIDVVDIEQNNDHNGQPLLGVDTDGNWTNVVVTATNGPAGTDFIRFASGIAQQNSDLSYTGYWDNLAITVELENVTGAVITNLAEGSNTVHLFSVDDDLDRPSDQLKSENTNFLALIDLTAPDEVPIQSAGPGTNDEFSEIDLEWIDVPNAGVRASDGDPLSPWDSYVIYLTEDATQPSRTNFNLQVRDDDISVLGTITTTNTTITNRALGTEYRLALVGLDEAGNESPVSGVVTVFLGGFSLTQGLFLAESAAQEKGLSTQATLLAWTTGQEPITRTFDLIFFDAPKFHPGFHPSITDEWQLAERIVDSWDVDTGTAVRLSPLQLTDNQMRFYRAAREDFWTNRNPKIASEEVYVAKLLQLEPGENWVSLFFNPDSNTLLEVFGGGTNTANQRSQLPGTDDQATSTRIEWYGATQNGAATNAVWLDTNTGWRFASPGPGPGVGSANDFPIPLDEGMNIIIDSNQVSDTQFLLTIGQVPTSTISGTVHKQITLSGTGIYNVVNWPLPFRIELTNSGLREAGFQGAPAGQEVNPNNSDEIRILQRGGGSLAAPAVRILMDGNGQFVFWSGGPFKQSAEFYHFEVDDTVIVRIRDDTSLVWDVELPYPQPTININP